MRRAFTGVLDVFHLSCTVFQKKTSTFKFLNNYLGRQPILIKFGRQYPEETGYQYFLNLIHLALKL